MRRLIVNADDLGYSSGVSRGVAEAHERGILTSASLMVEADAAADGVERAAALPRLGVGLHAWLDRGGQVVPPERCEEELERQLARFHELVGRPPTHVDSHHHVHADTRLLPAFRSFARRHSLPLRGDAAPYCGRFYGRTNGESRPERVGVAALLELLDGLGGGVTELGCHPGYADGLDSSYAAARERELATLTDPRVRRRVDELGIELIRWDEL